MRFLFQQLVLAAISLRRASAINHEGLLQVGAGNQETSISDSTGNAASPGVDGNGAFFDTTFFAPLPSKQPTESPTKALTPKPTQAPNPTIKPVNPPTAAPVPKLVGPPTFAPVPQSQQPTFAIPKPHPAPTNPPVPIPRPYPNLPPIPPNPYMVVPFPSQPSPQTYPKPPQQPAPTYQGRPPPTYQGPPPTYPKDPVPQPSPTYQIGAPPTLYQGPLPTYPKPPPVLYPQPPPVAKYPTPPPVKIDTRMSHYIAEWGAAKENCKYLSPNVFFNCHDGGVLQVHDTVNAICRMLSDDYVQCRQKEMWFDSYVQFTCAGIKHSHLMVTANVGPSPAWNCAKDGNAVKYLTISRTCYDENGFETSDRRPECEVGKPWNQGDVDYCASAAVCKFQGGTCQELELGSVTMSHRGKDMRCSRVDPTRDLQNYAFRESHLRSVNQVDWRFSGMGRGCQWESSPLLMRCENGGQLDLLEQYQFCKKYPEDNMAICESFAPYSPANEETAQLLVSCTGKNEDQLVLSVEIPSEDLDARCKPEGVAIQSFMLSRGCGEFGTDSFEFINDPKFCDNESQLFVVEDERSYCFVGETCRHPNGCDNLQLPVVTADTGTDDVGHCIYAV